MSKFDGLKVFSATMHQDRDQLGERVTEWIAANRAAVDIVEIEQLQSSDDRFHCLTIIVYVKRKVRTRSSVKS
jgi:hypothetical protein